MNYIIEDSTMSAIADAIREKTGTQEAFQVTDMASAIQNIPSGGGDDDAKGILEKTISEITNSANSIGSYAFANCSGLTSVSFPVCTSIDNSAFYYCSGLTSVSFPVCTSIGSYAFTNCSSLTLANFPSCTSIGSYAFANCSGLTSVSFPACTSIGGSAFRNCVKLTAVSFPVCTSIDNSAFYLCSSLTSVYLLSSSKCNLANANVFNNTPIAASSYLGYFGSIYVPESLVDTYKSETNWVTYADRITAAPSEMV